MGRIGWLRATVLGANDAILSTYCQKSSSTLGSNSRFLVIKETKLTDYLAQVA